MIQIGKILKQVPIFRMLGKESIDFIVERLKFKTYDADETICKIGDPGDTMYIIISGKVDICIHSKDSDNLQVVATLGAGDYFGEMSLLTGEPRSATVKTTEASEMFLLHKNDFDVILEKFPSISLSMGKIVSKRLRETLSKAAEMPRAKGAEGVTGPSGSLKDRPLIDLITFCESNSLTGNLIIEKGDRKGIFEYASGELLGVKLGDLRDDQALDEMLNWTDGKFEIVTKPLSLEEKEKREEEKVETKRILIVNNSLVVRKLIERAFKGLGYDVESAANIAKALDAVKLNHPDIIISDVKLEDGPGLDLCLKVREEYPAAFIFLADDSMRSELESKLGVIEKAEMTKTHEVSEIVKLVENMI